MKYTALIEQTSNGYSAYVLDLPGSIAAKETFAEKEELIRQGMVYRLEEMLDCGEVIPQPTSKAMEMEVALNGGSVEVTVETHRYIAVGGQLDTLLRRSQLEAVAGSSPSPHGGGDALTPNRSKAWRRTKQ